MRRIGLAVFLVLLSGVAIGQRDLSVSTAHDSEGENQVREQLVRLLHSYDLDKWIFSTSVVIDEQSIPHSHHVLTLHTRHIDSDQLLLSTFVHEEIHWHLTANGDQTQLAIDELIKMYPSAPAGGREGAGDARSTYLHLIVNYLEYQAMRELVGDQRAKEVFDFWVNDHYTWIYRTVLSDEAKIGEVVATHGLGI
jgi:hypothetical protein